MHNDSCGWAVAYIFMAFLLSYTVKTLGMVQNEVSAVMMVAAVVWFIATPYFSGLVDRVGQAGVVVPGSLALIVIGALLLPAAKTENLLVIGAALVALSIVLAAVYGPMAAMFSNLFPVEVRYSGASLGYQIGAILGGVAPLTATALLGWSDGAVWPVCVYLAVAGLISLGALLVLMKDRRRQTPPPDGWQVLLAAGRLMPCLPPARPAPRAVARSSGARSGSATGTR